MPGRRGLHHRRVAEQAHGGGLPGEGGGGAGDGAVGCRNTKLQGNWLNSQSERLCDLKQKLWKIYEISMWKALILNISFIRYAITKCHV